jgi:hypothetical protein
LPTVIPAKAGIQFEYVVGRTKKQCFLLFAQQTFVSCAAHSILHWIPAFAGMTVHFEAASTLAFSLEH